MDISKQNKIDYYKDYIRRVKTYSDRYGTDLKELFEKIVANNINMIKRLEEAILLNKDESEIASIFDMLDNYFLMFGKEDYTILKNMFFDIYLRIEGLFFTMEDIDDYFDYEPLYLYIKTKIKTLPTKDTSFFGLIEKNKDFTLVIPEIVNLKTAQVAVHEIRHGLDYIVDLYNEEESLLEGFARKEEDIFYNQYKKILMNKSM